MGKNNPLNPPFLRGNWETRHFIPPLLKGARGLSKWHFLMITIINLLSEEKKNK